MNDSISRQSVIDALRAMAVPRYKDPECEDIWERDRTLDNAIDVIRELPAVQPEQRWIPCKESKPAENKVYLVTLKGNTTDFCMWNGENWGWWADDVWCRNDDVIAFMPLPEPYREEEQ